LYCQELWKLENNFNGLDYMHILRGKNEFMDELAKLGSSQATVPTWVFLQELHEPSISKALAKATKAAQSSQQTLPTKENITKSPEVMEIYSDCCTSLMIYLRTGGLLEDMVDCEQLHHQAGQYAIVNDELFRRAAIGTLMKCITPDEGCAILQDIHARICGSHMGARSLVGKAYRQGFFWPTAVSDVDSLVRQCEGCQLFARQKHVSSHQLQTIPITWTFSTWGLDLVGPFKKAKGGLTDIFVVVDKFIKWIEVKPAVSITVPKEVEFIKEIIYRFGMTNNIIIDNGTEFTAREFKDFCADSGIKINYASVSDPKSNGQVSRSNGMILQGLKPRIFDRLKPYAGKLFN
jgi:hypothetical protein